MPQPLPPAQVAPAPAPPEALAAAQSALLEAYDWGRPWPPLPGLGRAALLSHRWLRTALSYDPLGRPPDNPFAAGSSRQEVQRLRALMHHPDRLSATTLQALSLTEPGTAMALWRWGQARVRRGTLPPARRRAWEDRLITAGPPLSRGYALRHALCHALAEQDEARFTALRALANPAAETTLRGFQRLFGLLGGPLPRLRLWSLPGLTYADLAPGRARRLWICPAEASRQAPLPEDTLWIIPSLAGHLDDRSATLDEPSRQEGEALAHRLERPPGQAWFAPSRAALESLGLAWFPILLELDDQGHLARIRMGDAAPAKP